MVGGVGFCSGSGGREGSPHLGVLLHFTHGRGELGSDREGGESAFRGSAAFYSRSGELGSAQDREGGRGVRI
jgi:hypothetical protein